ncbi:NADP-dependent oxidoreductase [Lentilactobacillus diolivorans]|uniref:NADP-dependent oxidoreductase n=1 Tax=Lentilactobacillus diolivorans TaxID=179838 RepID=UPI0024696F79|nr:NADP-dependent oxidoreductase [Lentilactobacillus diolivorans]MDH5107237.1 NADP-dependent oxidoreductase [Lentilactobacillus diolivorans]
MKAIGINQYGDSKMLQELNTDIPQIATNEVLVKTEAFAINPLDVAIREGQFKNSVILLFPMILGTDAVGSIVKVGTNVNNFHVGDEIIAHAGYGTYAEYFRVSSDHIGLRPSQYSLHEAAGLPLSGITAYNVLIHSAQARSGQRIAVFGASGGVGSMVVQMAKAYGLDVVAIDRQDTKAYVLSIGANEFISIDEISSPKVMHPLTSQMDIVIDASNFGKGAVTGVNLVHDGGTFVTLTHVPTLTKIPKNIILKEYVPEKKYYDSDAFAAITLMIRNNQLHTRIDKTLDFTLENVRMGQDYVATGKHNGKVVVSLNS